MLQNGDVFPSLTFARAGGGEIHLPGDLAGGFGVILFHRAFWCGFCNAQLAAFARAADKFGGEDIKIVSVSVDDREKTETLVESTSSVPRSPTAPMRERFPLSPAPSSIRMPSTSRRLASSSIRVRIVTAVYSAVWVWSATSNLRQSTGKHRHISREVDEWRNRL